MIYEFKYRFIRKLSEPLGNIFVNFLRINNFIDFDFIIPVPLHKRRLSWRGFNQSELLASQLNIHLATPIINDLLMRKRNTAPQMGINDKEKRIKNISDAFNINNDANFKSNASVGTKFITKQIIKNKSILLIDDICTTASTFENCAKAIGPLEPSQIWALALARG
jgi:predicted amidophosphoribosyltransferase